MTGGILRTRAGSVRGERRSTLDLAADRSRPPWRSWRTKSQAGRAIRWIETYCRIPSGANAGKLLRLAPFQKHAIEELLAEGVRDGGLQIPRGNAKSTLWAAVGLWALCDHADAPQVPLVSYNSRQALRNLFGPAANMVRAHPELAARLVVYTSNERRIWSAWNEGELTPLPADVERLQGLNPTLALIDEAQTIAPEIVYAVAQGAGKRPDSLVLTIGTPAPTPEARASALFDRRERARDGTRLRWIEYAADAGCALDDRDQWRKANPALDAGILYVDALEGELQTVDEATFRSYRLGQWLDVAVASWLPPGAWEANPTTEPPLDGSEIVLGLAGTWRSAVALVASTMDGEISTIWFSDTADDDDLRDAVEEASRRWSIVEIVVAPRIRPRLVHEWSEEGVPVVVWSGTRDVEVSSSTDFRRAIVEGRLPHDHDPFLTGHVVALVGKANPDGTLVLVAPNDATDVSAARAARYAWTRARDYADLGAPAIY